MEYPNLLSPGNIGNLTIKNRVVMPAMMLGHGQFDGTPTIAARKSRQKNRLVLMNLIFTLKINPPLSEAS